jgi:hypothetical protein
LVEQYQQRGYLTALALTRNSDLFKAGVDEIHGFLRHASWLRVDEATASFLARTLGVPSD